MLSLFRRSSTRQSAPQARSASRLRLEQLESRHCPAPVVSNVSVMQGMGHNVVITGNVTDQYMGGMKINVSGVGYGQGGLNSDGSFNTMVNCTSVGNLTVTATDMMSQTSAPVNVTITNAAPGISLYVAYEPNKQVRVGGWVTDEVVTTVRVYFSGMVTGTASVGSDGYYALTATPTGLGDVHAYAVDQWGLSSATATVTLTNSAPTISNFQVYYESGLGWYASGVVGDENPQGLTVTITDPNQNILARPEADAGGYFNIPINLPAGMYGSVTAQTTDWWGLQSNQAWQIVST